ncbi:NgoPII family restriction endonuclease [Leptolyngbya sp. AN03gr2]|uniref:NgoPII family restriction endonuclease n=1 Tax=Leptolyngbya sp. AN03gr2 TaxID=3423364 RepID=UPI003D3118A3
MKAVKTVIENPISDVVTYYRSRNRINAVGDSLELFIKDIFANTLNVQSEEERLTAYEDVYSYFGNANNPPDLMIAGGDAIEVKKLGSESSTIALNSSYPSAKLFANSPMLTSACRSCEAWTEKDLIYAIGCVQQEKLRSLWLVYGDCYAASREVYETVKQRIVRGIAGIQDFEFSITKELGRVNKIDPLGITSLRIRGMWQIEHPRKAFQYLNISLEPNDSLRVVVLLREEKYLSLPLEDRRWLEATTSNQLNITDVKIKSPDNPVKRLPAKLIIYQT